MHAMPAREYRDYWVICNAGEYSGYFVDAYTVHKNSPGTPAHQLAIVHQRPLDVAARFKSEAEAHASATNLAHAWIDQELAK